MIKFDEILSSVTPADFKFINQRTVRVVGLTGTMSFYYELSKSDVIKAINLFIERIHSFSDRPIRSEGMNFKAFKMHDLVPYLYTLINLYMSVASMSYCYNRFLPELKLTRFCHLPFEEEVIVNELPLLEVEVAYLPAVSSTCRYQYVALLSSSHTLAYDTSEELYDKLKSLYPLHRIVIHVNPLRH